MAAEDADEQEFMRQAWSSPVYCDASVVIYQADGEQAGGITFSVPAVRYQLAKASLVFRAQIERWGGSGGSGASDVAVAEGAGDPISGSTCTSPGRAMVLRVSVESRDEAEAMRELLAFIHTRELSAAATRDALRLYHLIRLANFYAVQSLVLAAAAALEPLAPQLPGDLAAVIFAALQSFGDSGSGGSGGASSGALQRVAVACLARLDSLLHPLSVVFSDEDAGQLFDSLPLSAVAALTQPAAETWVAQETAFLVVLRWLEANSISLGGEALEAATNQLLQHLEFARVDSAMLVVAAHTHPIFRGWSGALVALAAASFARDAAMAGLSSGNTWRYCFADLPGVQGLALAAAQPLQLELAVPLEWLQQEAARMHRLATQVQQRRGPRQQLAGGQGLGQGEVQPGGSAPVCGPGSLSEELAACFEGKTAVYRGYYWMPCLTLLMVMPENCWMAPPVSRPTLHGQLTLRAQALPTLLAHYSASSGPSSGVSSGSNSEGSSSMAHSDLGPLAQITCATAYADARLPGSLRWELEPASCKTDIMFTGAYRPIGPLVCLCPAIRAFESRPPGEPPHTLPDLSRVTVERSLHFRFTVSMRP